MKPIDHRNTTFQSIRARLNGARVAVYDLLLKEGPCTTRELAARSPLDLLTIRPRVTELVQLGLAVCDPEHKGPEGIYAALSLEDAEARWEAARREEQGEFLEMLKN